MSLLDRAKKLFSARSIENPASGWDVFLDVMNLNSANVKVNEATAQNLSAVFASNKILSEDVASLKPKLYRKKDGKTETITDHPISELLRNPNSFMSRFTFFETAQTRLDLWGNFYARIARDRNNIPVELIPIHPAKVESVIKNQLWYKVEGFNSLVNARDMVHVLAFLDDNDYRGISPILQAKEVIANGLALQEFSNRFFGNGANMSGILSTDQKLTPQAIENIKSSFGKNYQSVKNAQKVAVLESGLKYTKLSVEPEAAQFLQSRRFAVEEIARWFRIPPHMLADLERATFSNIEHQSISYVRQTLVPWLVRYEEELNRKLLTADESKEYFIKFNVEGLLRGDSAARAEYYNKLFNVGAIKQNEIRELENLNPVEGGDKTYVPLNMVDSNNTNTNE